MKFTNDKKSSLFIYSANEIIKGPDDKMEISLKKELEATKAALKVQTIRCRQLVAAFTRKLHEKELELKASKNLRDQQLSRLLRALLILESRLKKEQKLIRQQLEEKDFIIKTQEKEIIKYKRFETNRKWLKVNAVDGETTASGGESCVVPTGEERLDNLCKGLLNSSSLYLKPVDGKASNGFPCDIAHDISDSVKKEENTYKDNPVLESVNQILLRDEEELLKTAKPVSMNLSEKEDRNDGEGVSEWYETNSNIVSEENVLTTWRLNLEESEESKVRKDGWTAEKTSPIKCQLLEEKACLEMSRKNLTVVDLGEIDSSAVDKDRSVSPVKSTASYEEIAPMSKTANYQSLPSQQKPPALPPKPAKLLKPHQILQQQQQSNTSRPQGLQTSCPDNFKHPVGISINKPLPNKKPTFNGNQQVTGNSRISRSETKSLKPPEGGKGRMKPTEPCTKTKKNHASTHLPSALDLINCVGQPFANQKKADEHLGNCGAIKIGSSVSSLITGLSRDTIVTELNGEPTANIIETIDNSNQIMAKNNVVDGIQDDSHVSQLVRQFEVLGKIEPERKDMDVANDIRKNFEEFKLEESYVEVEETGRHDGDGAENKAMVNYYATLTIVPPATPKDTVSGSELEYKMYETFLENTGLSQKSILTPSRMLSNHRSCLKPKDVKHRSRVKAAAAFEKCNLNASNGGPTVKYWTEPFL